MSSDTSFTFYLVSDWTNDCFSIPVDNTIDTNHNTVNVYAFNGENYYHMLPELDRPHVYLHWDLSSSITNDHVGEMMTDKNWFTLRVPK
jgi:hypothetical protein